MSFLYPAFLLGALAVAVPIVLHLLRRDVAPEVPFTAVRLLHKSHVERAERRRLRDFLLLAARVAALVLLAAAFARPYLRAATPGPLRVVAIDRSYSMGAPGVFAAALERARQAIAATPRGERVAVVAFDDRADLVAAPGGAADARAALDGLDVGFGATRYEPVFQQAEQLAGGAEGRLVIVTDLQRGGWDAESPSHLPPGWTLDVIDATNGGGNAPQNLAISGVAVETTRAVATIRNTGAAARGGRVRLELDGREVAAADFNAGAGSSTEIPVVWRAPEAGVLRVAIDDPGGLAADDARFIALAGRVAPALIVTGGTSDPQAAAKPAALFLSRALGTASEADVDVISAGGLASISTAALATRPGIVLLSTRSLERPARERLVEYARAGGGLFIAASQDVEPVVLSEMTGWEPRLTAAEQTGPLTLAATDLRHPIFRPFGALAANLGQVRFDRAWRIAPDGWTVIARFSNGTPALLERTLGEGRVVLFASDVDRRWNDFPLHPAFVPFALETLRYVAGDRQATRDFTVAQAPSEARRTPGVYRSAANRPYAVNVDARESAPDRMAATEFARMVQPSTEMYVQAAERQARQTESRQSYWQYGLVLMIATLIAESVVGRA
jgi:hypothetical protein